MQKEKYITFKKNMTIFFLCFDPFESLSSLALGDGSWI